MKNKLLIWISALLILIGIVIAIPPNPEVYWGYVYVEGELAPNESVLSVETVSGELLVNNTLPIDPNYPGSYYVVIPFDNFHTPKDEGADAGEHITWKLNNINTLYPKPGEDTAEPGKTNNNFTISAILNPNLTANISSFNQSIILGDLINLTVILNNNGDGTANVTLNIAGNITTNLPKYLQVAKNNNSNVSVEIIPNVCKEFNPDLTINYYNLAGDLIDTLTKELSFSVRGYDIEIADITASNYSITNGTDITIIVIVSNKGDFDINGFNITFYDSLNDTIINSIDTNLTLLSGENTSITFNWQPAVGNHIITAAIDIAEDECDDSNNIKNSSEIVVDLESDDKTSSRRSSGGGGSEYSYIPAIEILNETANESIEEEVIEETENEETENETISEENKTTIPVTGMVAKETNYKKILPQFILMVIIVFGLLSVYYLFKKEKIIGKKQKLPAKKKEHKPEEKKEIKPKTEEKKQPVKEEKKIDEKIKRPRFFSIFKKPIKKTEEKKPLVKEEKKIDERVKIRPRSAIFTKPIKKTEKNKEHIKEEKKIDERVKIRPRSAIFTKPIKKTEKNKEHIKEEKKIDERVKIRPRSAIFTKPINKKPEVYKPKIKVNRDAAIVNIGSRLGLFKKREKEEFNIAGEPPRTEKSAYVSYDHLAMAVELIEQITTDKQPRDELIRKYGDKYPRFLIDMVGKYVFLNMSFDKKIDVMSELNKLEVLDQDYKYISHNKLEKAVDIIAKGYAMKEN